MSTAADQLWFAVTRFVSPNNSSEDALVVTFVLKEKKLLVCHRNPRASNILVLEVMNIAAYLLSFSLKSLCLIIRSSVYGS